MGLKSIISRILSGVPSLKSDQNGIEIKKEDHQALLASPLKSDQNGIEILDNEVRSGGLSFH